MNTDGFVLLNKETEITSFGYISKLRKALNIKKVGHAGTLDKFASGLLLTATGKATKLLKFFVGLPKTYIAEIKFRTQTETDDYYGSTINQYDGELDFNFIKSKLSLFEGKIKQTPPNYSAVHVEGKRAYQLAKKNIQPIIKEREVTISRLDVINFENDILTVEIDCSSGTYIRSIARDLGLSTGYFAHLSKLKRTQIGHLNISDSKIISEISKDSFEPIDPFYALNTLPALEVKEEYIKDIKNGKKFKLEWLTNRDNLQFDQKYYKIHHNQKLLAIIISDDNQNLKYDLVY